jgi:hypothetical protein
MPLANIHHFFNLHPLTFSLMLFGWLFSFMLTPTYCIISYENIIFYLCPFDLHPLYQEHSYGIKQGLGVEGTVTASVTFIGHHLLGVQLVTCLKSNLHTAVTTYNTTENNSIKSMHKTQLHFSQVHF